MGEYLLICACCSNVCRALAFSRPQTCPHTEVAPEGGTSGSLQSSDNVRVSFREATWDKLLNKSYLVYSEQVKSFQCVVK